MPKIPDSVLQKMAARPDFHQEAWAARAVLGSRGLGLTSVNVGKLVKAYQNGTNNKKATAWDTAHALIGEAVSPYLMSNLYNYVDITFLYPCKGQLNNVMLTLQERRNEPCCIPMLIATTDDTVYTSIYPDEVFNFFPDKFECLGPLDGSSMWLFRTKFTDWVKKFVCNNVYVNNYVATLLNA